MSFAPTLNLVDQTFINREGETIPAESLAQVPLVCYYVAAKWCPSSKKFRDELEPFYNTVNQSGKKLEIVYIGVDASDTDHKEQVASFPWLSMPFNSPLARKFLAENSITTIPSLLLIRKEDGSVVKKDCRGDVHFKNTACADEWVALLHEAGKEKMSLNESAVSKQLNNSIISKK